MKNRQSIRRNKTRLLTVAFILMAAASLSLRGRRGTADDDTKPNPYAAAQPGTASQFGIVEASGLRWLHLSSRHGDLPVPTTSRQQTAAVVADLDKDGRNDFVLAFRERGPALVWYRRTKTGWDRYVIEKEFLPIEAGGAVCDIDGDGYPDLVFGGDWQSNKVWWWRNPGKNWKPDVPWERHTIKISGATQHHDQCIADFKGTGKPQLAYWNQNARTLFVADIPNSPREVDVWPAEKVFSGATAASGPYPEGMSAFDIDGEGRPELLAGNSMFKYMPNGKWSVTKIGDIGGLIFAGRFIKAAKYPQIVIAPGDGVGPVKWYECKGSPLDSKSWIGHDLVGRTMIHPHSLQVADIDGDGNLDIFVAEMAKWSEGKNEPDNPKAQAFIFYGDGRGHFRKTVFTTGMGFHEAQLADLDGDGRLDILSKPYNWDAPRVDVWLNQGPARAAKAVGVSASFRGPVGLQLYSLRDMLGKDIVAGLKTARGFGFSEVELAGTYGLPPVQFRRSLENRGLKAVSAIVDYGLVERDTEAVARQAEELGVSYVGVGWIPHQGQFDEAVARRAAVVFNRAGKVLAKHGIKFFYHNHGYEFVPYGDGTLFDVLAEQTDPRFVKFEMDVFWTVHPGQDPVKLLAQVCRPMGAFPPQGHEEVGQDGPTDRLRGCEQRRCAGHRADRPAFSSSSGPRQGRSTISSRTSRPIRRHRSRGVSASWNLCRGRSPAATKRRMPFPTTGRSSRLPILRTRPA